MQVKQLEAESSGGVEPLALDWESLGRLVRVRTLQAVAMDFEARAIEQGDAPDSAVPNADRKSE